MKYEIDIEGLPEGWAIKELKFTAGSIENITPGYPEYEPSITSAKLRCYLMAEKIPPRRIVLEETGELNHVEYRTQNIILSNEIDGVACVGIRAKYVWREVK